MEWIPSISGPRSCSAHQRVRPVQLAPRQRPHQDQSVPMKTLDDPLRWLLLHPERFFRSEMPNGRDLAEWVRADAMLSGSSDVLVHNVDDFWVVAAPTSWLHHNELSPEEMFRRMIPQPTAGPNSMRGEVLLNAFCSDVVATVSGKVVFSKGNVATEELVRRFLRRRPRLEAAIAFRVPSQGSGRKRRAP